MLQIVERPHCRLSDTTTLLQGRNVARHYLTYTDWKISLAFFRAHSTSIIVSVQSGSLRL